MHSLCSVAKISKQTYFIDEEFMGDVGNKIRQVRISKGLTIEKLAFKCEVSYSQISRMELGKVNFTISFLPKIAKALNVSVHELIP